jgi:formylglycine-generating enzyme required for sulfatase activity
MVWVPGGAFTMGSDAAFPEEGPAVPASVPGFWMDQTEVTNAQFAAFVAATGYRTLAERGVRIDARPDAPVVAGSAVFRPRGSGEAMRSFANWWQFMPGADWRHPDGPGSSIAGREQHPVVHVAYEDALAYARWKGRGLPTEEQFEYAARGSGRRRADGSWSANTWQGSFPQVDTAADGHAGSAPVACYGADRFGLYDLIGNVWEWTTSPYYARHDAAEPVRHPRGFDPAQAQEQAVAVLKGGSFLCAPDYCMRYRPEARIGQAVGLGAAHIGFRTVLAP